MRPINHRRHRQMDRSDPAISGPVRVQPAVLNQPRQHRQPPLRRQRNDRSRRMVDRRPPPAVRHRRVRPSFAQRHASIEIAESRGQAQRGHQPARQHARRSAQAGVCSGLAQRCRHSRAKETNMQVEQIGLHHLFESVWGRYHPVQPAAQVGAPGRRSRARVPSVPPLDPPPRPPDSADGCPRRHRAHTAAGRAIPAGLGRTRPPGVNGARGRGNSKRLPAAAGIGGSNLQREDGVADSRGREVTDGQRGEAEELHGMFT